MTDRQLDTMYPGGKSGRSVRRTHPSEETGKASSPEEIVRRLRRAIVRGELAPGSLLVQADLADRFGVSRIPLREALRALDAEGLVVMRSGQGATVTKLTSQDALDLYHLRLAIEPPLAGRIVEYAGPRDLQQLRRYVDALEQCGEHDQQRFSDINLEFHVTMYRIADRPAYTRFVERALASIEPYSRMYLHLLRGSGRAQSEHVAMVRAVENREAETLSALITSHLEGARKALVDHLDAVERGENLPPEIYGVLWTAEGDGRADRRLLSVTEDVLSSEAPAVSARPRKQAATRRRSK